MTNQPSITRTAISRRSLLKNTAAIGLFTIVPRNVLGGTDQTPPSEKLNIACVGVGGKGHSDATSLASQNIVAMCDVDDRYAAGAFNEFPQAKRYRDYRVMLEQQKDIDAVVVATPDHTHALIALTAMKMGKHVFCQKPLTHTVEEAQIMARVAREMKVANTMGNQGQAEEGPRRIRELIEDGVIGAVREVHAWTDRPMQGAFNVFWPQGVDRPGDTRRYRTTSTGTCGLERRR
jgi:predicted dehydrogenase